MLNATVLCPSVYIVCNRNVCIVAKRCVLPKTEKLSDNWKWPMGNHMATSLGMLTDIRISGKSG